jgi:hypothetical protein
MGPIQPAISRDFGRPVLLLCKLCLQCSTVRCPFLSSMNLLLTLMEMKASYRNKKHCPKKIKTLLTQVTKAKIWKKCRELRLTIQQMAQETEEGQQLLQNSIQLLQHEKVKLTDDLQNTCQRTLSATGGKHKLSRSSRFQPGRERSTSNPRHSKERYHAKLEKLVSSSAQGRTHLNFEVGNLNSHIQSRNLQINARKDVKRRRKKPLDLVNQNYYRKKPHDAQEFTGNRITDTGQQYR